MKYFIFAITTALFVLLFFLLWGRHNIARSKDNLERATADYDASGLWGSIIYSSKEEWEKEDGGYRLKTVEKVHIVPTWPFGSKVISLKLGGENLLTFDGSGVYQSNYGHYGAYHSYHSEAIEHLLDLFGEELGI